MSRDVCTVSKGKRWICDDLEKPQSVGSDFSDVMNNLRNLLGRVGELAELGPSETEEKTPKVKRHSHVSGGEIDDINTSIRVRRHSHEKDHENKYSGPRAEDFMVDARMVREENEKKRLKVMVNDNKMFSRVPSEGIVVSQKKKRSINEPKGAMRRTAPAIEWLRARRSSGENPEKNSTPVIEHEPYR